MFSAESWRAALEQRAHWEATAKNKDGNLVFVMRGSTDDPLPHYEKGFYTWVGGQFGYPYTPDGIRNLFATGQLELLKSRISEDYSGYVAFADALSC
jgi:hypothetical protein